MPSLRSPIEKPRKQPVQARSTATVEAILEATLQVLLRVGKEKLTTTLVAQRAGVSVGTLYQYFPNKRSLLQALLRRNLSRTYRAVEQACERSQGQPLAEIVLTVATAFFAAKMANRTASLALYAVSADVDGLRVTEDLRRQSARTFEQAVRSSTDRLIVPASLVASTLQSAMIGVVRHMIEAGTPAQEKLAHRKQMLRMLTAYAHSVVAQ